MGRSVSYHSDRHAIIYTHLEFEEEYDKVDFDWQEYKQYLLELMQEVAPSFEKTKPDWQGNEVIKFAENGLCSVWLSEYYDLVSISFVPREQAYTNNNDIYAISCKWIDQVVPKIEKLLGKSALKKTGTFSNGEGVYQLAN